MWCGCSVLAYPNPGVEVICGVIVAVPTNSKLLRNFMSRPVSMKWTSRQITTRRPAPFSRSSSRTRTDTAASSRCYGASGCPHSSRSARDRTVLLRVHSGSPPSNLSAASCLRIRCSSGLAVIRTRGRIPNTRSRFEASNSSEWLAYGDRG
jgi:hypothetical protein